MQTFFLVLSLCILFLWSFYLRMEFFRNYQENLQGKTSPISLALQELVAVAGGIYLALILLVSFLKINLPEVVLIRGVTFDPLACSSIFLTVIQPVVTKIIHYLHRR